MEKNIKMLSTKDICLYFIAILLFHSSIIKFYYSQYGNVISLTLGVIVFLYLLLKIKVIFRKKFLKVNAFIIIYSVIAFLSSLFNDFYNFDGTLLYILKFANLFLFFEYSGEINKNKNVIKIFFFLLLLYDILTIIMMNQTPHLAYYHNYQYPFYSSKFTLSYYFMITIVLYIYAFKDLIKKKLFYKIIALLLCYISIAMSIRVDCVTGIIGNLLLFLMLMIPFSSLKKIIRDSNKVVIIMIIASFALIVFYDLILNISFVNNIIVDNFGRNSTLSGRNVVYQKIPDYMFSLKGLTFGYSYDGIRRIFQNVMYIQSGKHYAFDAQNALLEIWMYFGLIGAFVFMSLVKTVYSKFNKLVKADNDEIYILALIFIILGLAEITYSFPMFLLFSIINSDNKSFAEEDYIDDKKNYKKNAI
jgi:hypothetical protein